MAWQNGWWLAENCVRLPSANFDARPAGVVPDLVVVHNISLPPFAYGQGAVQKLFTNRITADEPDDFMRSLQNLHVSSHFLIERSGALFQFVSCDDAAYQAGVSRYQGRQGCNAFSIGIELEGCDFEPFEEAQYTVLTELLQELAAHYPIRAVAGHQHIAPGRKTDPGHFFDWERLRQAGVPVDENPQWP